MPPSATEHIVTRSERKGFTCPWWVIGLLLIGFIAIAIPTAGSNTLTLDLTVSERIQTLDSAFARFLGWLGDHLGSTIAGLACLTLGFVAAALLRSARDAWFLGIAAVLRLAATFLKPVSDSPRPSADQVHQLQVFESTGFPSGHATTATLLMGTLAFMVARRTERRAYRIALGVIWAIGASVTGLARIWHGAHWFTDTIGGTIVGLLIVLVAANLSATIMQARSSVRRTPRSQTQAR